MSTRMLALGRTAPARAAAPTQNCRVAPLASRPRQAQAHGRRPCLVRATQSDWQKEKLSEDDPRMILRVSPGTSFFGLLSARKEALAKAQGDAKQEGRVQGAFEQLISSARKRFEDALAKDPKSADAHYDYGNFSQTIEDTDRAEQLYRKALELNADHVDSLNNLGVLLIARGGAAAITEAEGLYERALKANPKDVDSMFNLAELKSSRGDKKGAAEMVTQILALRPDLATNSALEALQAAI